MWAPGMEPAVEEQSVLGNTEPPLSPCCLVLCMCDSVRQVQVALETVGPSGTGVAGGLSHWMWVLGTDRGFSMCSMYS